MSRSRSNESAVAIPMAIAIAVIGMFVVIALVAAAFSTRDRARDASDRALASGPAEEGIATYAKAISGGGIGEHTNFSLTRAALLRFIREVDPSAGTCTGPGDELCLLPNASTGYPRVDERTVPAADRLTVRRRAGTDSYRFWQVFAISAPRLGATDASGRRMLAPGGRVVVYIRGWQGASDDVVDGNRAVLLRAEVRPPRFSDYQLVVDGKMIIPNGVTVNGRIHSNGFADSYLDQYSSLPDQITVRPGAWCTGNSRFSTRQGNILLEGASCSRPEYRFPNTGEHVNLLRALDSIRAARSECLVPTPGRSIAVACVGSNNPAFRGPYVVTLSGTTATVTAAGAVGVTGLGRYSTANTKTTFPIPMGGQFGLVLHLDRSVIVRGTATGTSRVTIIASNRTSIRLPEVPSIFIDRRGPTGAQLGNSTASVGLVADGDIVAMEARDPAVTRRADTGDACGSVLRAAVVAQGGMLTRNPRFRGGAIPGAPTCNGAIDLVGSIAAHHNPYLSILQPDGTVISGFAGRTYRWDDDLYHNPPPLFPTVGPWEVLASTPADLTCFDDAGGSPRLVDRLGCS